MILATITVGASLAPPRDSDLWRNRLGNESHGHFSFGADTGHLIQSRDVAERFEQMERRLAIRFTDGHARTKTTQEINAFGLHLFQRRQNKVTQIAND